MKMRISFLVMLALSICKLAYGRMNASMKTEAKEDSAVVIDAKEFDQIECSAVCDIYFTQGRDYSVKFKEGNNIRTDIKVKDNVLVIKSKNIGKIGKHENSVLWVTAPDINNIHMSGVGKFVSNSIETSQLNIKISGVSNANIDHIKVSTFDVKTSGVGHVTIGSLNAEWATIGVSGVGKFTTKVEAKELNLTNSGVGTLTVDYKGGTVDLKNSGVGKVFLTTDCTKLTAKNSGVGKVKISGTADNTSINSKGVSKIDTSELNKL